jgi:hypothetical protein
MRTIGTLLFCGLLLMGPAKAGAPVQSSSTQQDPRLTRLQNFFSECECPVAHLAQTFLRAADRHGIDWRLLPAIAFIESTGGKDYRNNNVLGWGNGDIRFRTISEGIRTVAERLANSIYYRGKNIDQILVTYNPRPEYRRKVKAVMREIESA